MALAHPTCGYRLLHQELRDQGERVGLHKVRVALSELNLNPPQPRKTRKAKTLVTPPVEWPSGRRVQIDATRLSLPDGTCWVYFVLDVESRAVLASRATRSLSKHLAKLTLDEGVAVLRRQGVSGAILVQSDGGSDFTSEVFQQACSRHGSWVRCKVSQVGGMGVLERLNRTFKYQFAFRQDWLSLGVSLPHFVVQSGPLS